MSLWLLLSLPPDPRIAALHLLSYFPKSFLPFEKIVNWDCPFFNPQFLSRSSFLFFHPKQGICVFLLTLFSDRV